MDAAVGAGTLLHFVAGFQSGQLWQRAVNSLFCSMMRSRNKSYSCTDTSGSLGTYIAELLPAVLVTASNVILGDLNLHCSRRAHRFMSHTSVSYIPSCY